MCVKCETGDKSFANFYGVLARTEADLLYHLLLRGVVRKTSVRGTDGGT